MPLITPQAKPPERQAVSYKLEARIFRLLKRYAEFIDSTQEYVVNQALDATFARDREFRAWVASQCPEDDLGASAPQRPTRKLDTKPATSSKPAADAESQPRED